MGRADSSNQCSKEEACLFCPRKSNRIYDRNDLDARHGTFLPLVCKGSY